MPQDAGGGILFKEKAAKIGSETELVREAFRPIRV
jgi:hypothetical protein